MSAPLAHSLLLVRPRGRDGQDDHSAHAALLAALDEATGGDVVDVPVPVGGDDVEQWLPAAVRQVRAALDRSGGPRGGGDVPVVHAVGCGAVLAATAACAPPGTTVVAHVGDGPPPSADRADRRCGRLLWAAARTAQVVVTDSGWARERAVAHGVDPARAVRAMPVAAAADADAWAPAGHGRRVLLVGALGRGSAGADVLAALRPLVHVDVVVGVPAGSGAAFRRGVEEALAGLPEACRPPGARLRVAPLDGRSLAEADLVVDAGCEDEGSHGVVAAMTHRRAVVAPATGPRPEVLVDGVTGRLVDGHGAREWARVLGPLLDDPFRLEAYGEAGADRARAVLCPRRRAGLVLRLHDGGSEASANGLPRLLPGDHALVGVAS
ncbi:glycosyltransferase family protein [Thalassiella azotivora]